jgi:hypothetical protein
MIIKEATLKNLLGAIHKVGEPEVENILHKLQDRNKMIDEVVDLICERLDINKSFVFLKSNHGRSDAILAIVFILKKNNVAPIDIKNYFSYPTMRVNEIYNSFFDLADNIPYQKKLKQLIFDADMASDLIFRKYYYNNTTNGNKES